jgi:hypothetical protein
MQAFLRREESSSNKKFYDLRYFYFDDQRVARYTCGIAFRALMAIYREANLTDIDTGHWYKTVRTSQNPVVRGFIAEQVCLAAIRRRGLSAVDPALNQPLATEHFKTLPDWGSIIESESEHPSRLYLPMSFNFRNIDAAILWLNSEKTEGDLYLIQVTLAKNHKDSAQNFFTKSWGSWKASFPEKLKAVYPRFVWIDEKDPSVKVKKKVIKATRRAEYSTPEYLEYHVSVGLVDSNLYKKLSADPLTVRA